MPFTFYSIPVIDIDRLVTFSIDSENLQESWAVSSHLHVFSLHIDEDNTDTCYITNNSSEIMALCAYENTTFSSFYIGTWQPNEIKHLLFSTLYQGVFQPEYYFVLNDTPVFQVTAYIHRKKKSSGTYARQETITIHKGVYQGLGAVATALNHSINMRGERNGYIFHFITLKGKLSMEASHKQPEPSFMEIVPLVSNLGLTEESVLRLRTKERVDFPYSMTMLM